MARMLGFNDEVTVCDRCGKNHLKGTYAVEDNGDIKRYGSVCIGYIYGKHEAKQLKARAEIVNILRHAPNRERLALMWCAWGTKDGWIIDGYGQRVIEAY